MKDYKRLTTRDLVGTYINMYEFANEVKKWQERHGLYDYMGADTTQILIERLADIEDKIENGTLIELPCKVGDTVWKVERGYDYNNDTYFWHIVEKPFELGVLDYWWGKMIFPTKAEAEAQLAELKGERE